ncbi:zincin-like metallopeptidase toxin domain-containing protein [Paenibacillus sp. FSL E2-0178]|uniref:zincin-like metallopeptidase toxin domain-containing protein n=1 Tax=Paenibacillus sp. FSL E2-0178 TaxID=2921361 RepID=UPI003158E51F
MSAGKMVFDADEARRLQTKISQVSEDTNRLYLQLKGQASQWDGLPIGTGRLQAQVLINELTVEAEKLEDLIRIAVKGVQDVQDESKRQAGQLSQQFGIFGGMFGSFGAGFGSAGRLPIPAFAQKISTNLISSIAILSGKDELNSDPMVRKLLDMNSQSGLGTVDSIAVQSKLKDIYEARDQIAKAQTAFGVYQAFGNQAQMDRVHQLAEEARAKLKSFGVDEVQYQAGKDLSVYFKQPAVKACKYDPSITSGNVPLVQNEAYLLLLRMGMEDGVQGKWAKGQLEGIHATMKQMIATGVNLGVHMMTNQGAEAWGDVARLTSSFAQLESYNLFKSKAPDEQPEAPEKSKNAFLKSLDSFKEIGTGFMDTLRIRADKATDSPYDFVNWITLGIAGDLPVGIYRQAKERADHMLDSPEKFADWLTLGTVEMGKGAFHPEESWSAEHWLNSLGVVSLLVGPLEKSLLSTGGELPKPMISKNAADNGMDIFSKDKGGQGIEGTGNFDYKEWADMPVSGQVKFASNGQRLISIRDLKMFAKEMNAKNIRVIIDSEGKILPSFADGGFNPKTGQIVLKKEPTYLSAKHESYHAQQWLELGQEKYLKLTTLEREEFVYSQIMKNKDLYTSEEILFSQKYIFKLRTGEWPPPGWKGFE